MSPAHPQAPTPKELLWTSKQHLPRDKFEIEPALAKRISQHIPNSYAIIRDGNKPVGYTTQLPSTYDQMRAFLDDKTNEEELITNILEAHNQWRTSTCVYLHSAHVILGHRQKGHALKTALHALANASPPAHATLYARPTSYAGREALKKLSQLSGRTLYLKN